MKISEELRRRVWKLRQEANLLYVDNILKVDADSSDTASREAAHFNNGRVYAFSQILEYLNEQESDE